MRLTEHSDFESLQAHAPRWNQLAADVPFRRWQWVESWWRHYGEHHGRPQSNTQLLLLAVWDQDQLVAVAPWYLHRQLGNGRAIKPLGSGETCSDYLTILCQPGFEPQVGRELAAWLTDQTILSHGVSPFAWDILELSGIAAGDRAVHWLIHHLEDFGNDVYCSPGMNCWRIELPNDWPTFVAGLSKSHRKQVRRLERSLFETREVSMHRVEEPADFNRAFDVLVDLHQRRWQSLRQRGCFASRRFLNFHREVLERMLPTGQADLIWFELDGQPLAAEYQLLGGGTVYAYQSGVDPQRMDCEPGRLAVMATIQRAIQQQRQCYDFLRGNEPYKAHWRAEPRSMIEVQVVPPRAAARLRHGVSIAGGNLKSWIKSGLEFTGLR